MFIHTAAKSACLVRYIVAVGIAVVTAATPALAVVSPVAYWRLGEDDMVAIPTDPCHDFTIDALGGFDLERDGTLAVNKAFYSSDVSPAAANHAASSLAIRFDNATPTDPCFIYQPSDPCRDRIDNFGLEMWVRPTSTTPVNGTAALVGGGGYEGNLVRFGIFQYDGTYSGFVLTGLPGGIEDPGPPPVSVGSVPVTTDWVHLALVVAGGTTTLYRNGVAAGSAAATPIEGTCFDLAALLDGSAPFAGSLDEVRLFTFEPGQFSPNDLLVNQVPEPSTLMLLVIGAAAALHRRRS